MAVRCLGRSRGADFPWVAAAGRPGRHGCPSRGVGRSGVAVCGGFRRHVRPLCKWLTARGLAEQAVWGAKTARLTVQNRPSCGAERPVLVSPRGLPPWRWSLGAHLFLVTVCIALPVLSSIYMFSWLFVADITEKPSTPAQNTVPSVGFTVRASEPDVLTT